MKEKMRKNKQVFEILATNGYRLEDLLDTDDSGYDFEDAILYEEVRINFERKDKRAERI